MSQYILFPICSLFFKYIFIYLFSIGNNNKIISLDSRSIIKVLNKNYPKTIKNG